MSPSTRIQRTIASLLVLLTFIIVLFSITLTNAGEYLIRHNLSLKSCVGVKPSFTIYQGADALIAELSDHNMQWEIDTYYQTSGHSGEAQITEEEATIYPAGIFSNETGSGIGLNEKRRDGDNAFFLHGITTWNIINPIGYVLDYWLSLVFSQKEGNCSPLDIQKPPADEVGLSMTAFPTLQGHRSVETESWIQGWLKKNANDFNLEMVLSEGLLVTYKFVF